MSLIIVMAVSEYFVVKLIARWYFLILSIDFLIKKFSNKDLYFYNFYIYLGYDLYSSFVQNYFFYEKKMVVLLY